MLSLTERRFLFGMLAVPAGALMTPPLFFFAALCSGGGHTAYPFVVYFPYAMLPQSAGVEVPGPLDLLLWGLQLPAYAVTLATSRGGRQLLVRAAIIIVVHFMAVAVCFAAERRRGGPDAPRLLPAEGALVSGVGPRPARRLTTACSGRANQHVFYLQWPVRAADAGR